MLSLGIGKEFLHKCVVSSCLKVNLSISLEEYKGIHPPSRSILVSLKKVILQRLLQGVKGLTPL
jgi:hypothetical protein